MRSLPSIEGQTLIRPQVRLSITPVDASTTYVHCSHAPEHGLVDLSTLRWQGPFAGGLALPSAYKATADLPVDVFKARRAGLAGAAVRLEVLVNSDWLQPHVGVLRGWNRPEEDLDLIEYQVADRFLDTMPQVPAIALVDSWTPHLKDAALGYPRYYGAHTRPAWMVMVGSGGKMLGPRNVSSANHVSSLWFYHTTKSTQSHPNSGVDIAMLAGAWEQQSGGTNIASTDFRVLTASDSDTRWWHFEEASPPHESALLGDPDDFFISSESTLRFGVEAGVGYLFSGRPRTGPLTAPFSIGSYTWMLAQMEVVLGIKLETIGLQNWKLTTTVDSSDKYYLRMYCTSGALFAVTSLDEELNPSSMGFIANSSSLVASLDPGRSKVYLSSQWHQRRQGDNVQRGWDIKFQGIVNNEEYRRYSICAFPTNSAEVAVSENPFGIVSHLCSHELGLPFLSAQNSQAQADRSAYKFHCFFAERRPATEILSEFGALTAVDQWLGDSGMLHARSYQESAGATVDATLERDDWLKFRLRENPLRSGAAQSERVRELTLRYGWDFQQQQHLNSLRAFPANTALCNSASAAGIARAKTIETEYILDTDTASRALGNAVRRETQGQSFIEGEVPAEWAFRIEPYDVLRARHPMIPGSESLYQVIELGLDVMQGRAEVVAAELLSLNP